MDPIKLTWAGGLYRQGTGYQCPNGRFSDAALMRMEEGVRRPMKGWATGLAGTLTGNPRAAHAWFDNGGDPFAAFGTHTGLSTHDATTLDDVPPTPADDFFLESGSDWLLEDGGIWLNDNGFAAGDADLSTWSLDNLDGLLIACNDTDKTIFEWQPGGGDNAIGVTNSPTASAIFVTEEGFLVALGADGDPRRVAWSDQDNRTTWAASSTNQAGDLNLQTPGIIACGTKVRGGGLIWTTEDVHLMRFIGLPDVYGIERVAGKCGIIGRHAFVAVDTVAYWMGQGKFWKYAGYVEAIPCDISDDVFTNLNATYQSKVWCRFDAQHGEVWFYYPRGTSTECSHYAIYNTADGTWNHGPMSRCCGFGPEVFGNPILVNFSGAMLKHEYGWAYDEEVLLESGSPQLLEDSSSWSLNGSGDRFLISGPVEINSGGKLMFVDEIIPDEIAQGDCEVYFYLREYPTDPETVIGPFGAQDRVPVEVAARLIRMEIRGADTTQDFRVGTYRVIGQPWSGF